MLNNRLNTGKHGVIAVTRGGGEQVAIHDAAAIMHEMRLMDYAIVIIRVRTAGAGHCAGKRISSKPSHTPAQLMVSFSKMKKRNINCGQHVVMWLGLHVKSCEADRTTRSKTHPEVKQKFQIASLEPGCKASLSMCKNSKSIESAVAEFDGALLAPISASWSR
jgi:hypothetical protein